jgi:GAF domain-containing protein
VDKGFAGGAQRYTGELETQKGRRRVEPVPETAEVLNELLSYGDTDLAVLLLRLTRRVTEIAPHCVGLSYALLGGEEDITFTMVSSDVEAAVLDGVQYLEDGPCVEAARSGRIIEQGDLDPLDEQEWRRFAQASAAAGIASSLSIPLLSDGRVIGGVNLYGGTENAFSGHVDELAVVCRGWAPGAVTNADLTFRSRLAAARAPQVMRDRRTVDIAIGMLSEATGVSLPAAEEHLRRAAARAGIRVVELAEAVVANLDESRTD